MKKLFFFLLSLTLTATALSGCSFLSNGESSSPSSSIENSQSSEQKGSYSVVFKQEGQNDIVKTVEEGKALMDIPTPAQKTGYTTKWSVEDFSNITADLTVTAVSTANEYTITYDAGEGAVEVSTQKVTYDTAPGSFATPTREAYIFVCWTYNGNAILPTDVWKLASDVILVAKWKAADMHTVTFVQAGHEAVVVDVVDGDILTSDKIPQTQPKEGYTVVWEDKLSAPITENLIVNAISTPNTYTITYDAGEGTVTTATQEVTYDATPQTFAVPTRDNYVFVCWTYNGNAILPTDAWKIANDVTLVAKWRELENLVIEFVQTGYESLTFDVVEGSSFSMDGVAAPQQITGYTVTWDLSNVDLTNITTSLVITTKATPNKYTVTYDAGEGTVAPLTQEVTYDAAPGSFAVPTREHYKFVAWTYNGVAVSALEAWTVAENVTLVAQWQEKQKYTVEFVQTGYETLSFEVYEGEALSMDDVAAPQQQTGYTVAWDLNNVDLNNVTTSLVIMTKATANNYKITYDANGGQVSPTTKLVTYDAKPGSFAIPTRAGYQFKGWEYEGKVISANDVWTIAQDVTLTAKWAKVCTITLNANGGTLTQTQITVVIGEAYTLPTPSLLYYNFAGWKYGSTSIATSGVWTLDVAEITLMAEWLDDGWTKNY